MAADESSTEVGIGTPVVVVRVSANPPPQHHGEVAKLGTSGLAVRLAGDPTLTPGEPVLLVAAGAFPRIAARGRFAASQGALCAFQLDGSWRSLDPRRETRYQMRLDAEVRSVLGTSRQAGAILDISPSGASVAVPVRPGGRQVELFLGVTGYAAALPCEVLGATEAEESAVLHLRFGDLSPAQLAFLRHVIGVARAASEELPNQMAS